MTRRLELLAPARSADVGIAAISCGADAVYIGGPGFGARSAASNSQEDIRRLCEAAAPFGAKVYVTVNTLARNDAERREMVHMMLSLKDIGISAFIMQDCTLLPLLKECGPWRESFHASTQCTTLTPERAVFLASLGFSRIVLERQLSIEEIKAIRKALPEDTELEFFVHGALCTCFSGECYLSEHLTGRSANRGECAQPCRNLYDLLDRNGDLVRDPSGTPLADKPLLSLKDLNLIGRLEDIADAGVMSLKIEGRLKNASYVKNIVRAYSDALDKMIARSGGKYARSSLGTPRGGFVPNPDKTFSRGWTALMVDGNKGGWSSGDAAKSIGENIGRAHIGRNGKLSADAALHTGDGLCFIAPDGRVKGFRVEKVEPDGARCSGMEGLKEGTLLYRNRDAAFERELEHNTPERLINAAVKVEITSDTISLTETSSRTAVEESIAPGTPTATNQERIRQIISSQIGKTAGIYSFSVEEIIYDGPLPLLSAASLNALRRRLAEEMEKNTSPEQSTSAQSPANPLPEIPQGTPLAHSEADTLLRSRYCILGQRGLCLKGAHGQSLKMPLKLRNNGTLLPLEFDCSRCEMKILRPKR